MESDEERIRQRAHALWEQAGRPDGQSDEFWRRAERDVSGAAPEEAGTTDDVDLDEALTETFPASDPPANTGITGPEVTPQPAPAPKGKEAKTKESTRTTGNDPAAADPGGTKPAPSTGKAKQQNVRSGDRNKASAKRR